MRQKDLEDIRLQVQELLIYLERAEYHAKTSEMVRGQASKRAAELRDRIDMHMLANQLRSESPEGQPAKADVVTLSRGL